MKVDTIQMSDIGSRLRHMLAIAVQKAEESEFKFRHGAVLFCRNKVIESSPNKYRTVRWAWKPIRDKDPIEMGEQQSNNMHAEIGCMHNVDREIFSKAEILVVRINQLGVLRNSKPCTMCQDAMKLKGVRRCYYSTGMNTLGCMIL